MINRFEKTETQLTIDLNLIRSNASGSLLGGTRKLRDMDINIYRLP